MAETLRMEVQRIRTLPAIWILAFVAVALGTVAAAFLASTPPKGTLSGPDTRAVITGAASASILPFVGLPLLCLGVMAVLEDTRYKLAGVLLVAQPRRSTLMVARLIILTVIAVAACVLQMVLSTVIATLLGRAPQFAEIPGIVPPYLCLVVVFVWAGAALGWLTGAAGAPIGVVLVEMLLIEPLAKVAGAEYSDDLENWTKRLPFTAARDALAPDPAALVMIVGYAALLLGLAWWAVRERDY